MTCPGCSQTVPAGGDRCPGCGRLVAPAVEGALATLPQAVTPPARDKVEPLREIPGLRKRERTWKDEVRERVRVRRHERIQGGELPLFPQAEVPAEEPDAATESEATSSTLLDEDTGPRPGDEADPGLRELGDEAPELLLRSEGFDAEAGEPQLDPTGDERLPFQDLDGFDAAPAPRRGEARSGTDLRPVERPAQVGERLQAAAVDLVVLLGLWAVVLYFAGRAARVGVFDLRGVWPFVIGYLAFLGVVYAGYFTGTTGRTVGKMWCGLRVVDRGGNPLGFVRAAVRAVLGTLGVLLAGAGLIPILFDPARRAVHDRLLRTRVIRQD